jgi:hypothetical protein
MADTIEKRVESLEYHVHGWGWWLRLLAWVGMVIIVTIGFVVQTINANRDTRQVEANRLTASATCKALIVTQTLLIESEQLEIQEQQIDEFQAEPQTPASKQNQQAINNVIVEMKTARQTLIHSGLCTANPDD